MFPLMKTLNKVPVTTISYDLRGRGNSFKPQAEPGNYGITHHVNDLLELMDSLKISEAQLVGHSFGCWIALYAATLQPERVRSITMLDGGSPESSLQKLKALRLVKKSVSRLGKLYATKDEYLRAIHDTKVLDVQEKAIETMLIYELQKAPGRGYFVGLDAATIEAELRAMGGSLELMQLGKKILQQTISPTARMPIGTKEYRALNCPVQVFRAARPNFSMNDQLMSMTGAQALANMIPRCTVYNVKSANHYDLILAKNESFKNQFKSFISLHR